MHEKNERVSLEYLLQSLKRICLEMEKITHVKQIMKKDSHITESLTWNSIKVCISQIEEFKNILDEDIDNELDDFVSKKENKNE